MFARMERSTNYRGATQGRSDGNVLERKGTEPATESVKDGFSKGKRKVQLMRDEGCEGEAKKRTVVVFILEGKLSIATKMVYRIVMRSKKMQELLWSAAKKQQQCQPDGKDNMCNSFEQTDFPILKLLQR
jgi:hypothetical protein